ncbi:unnamed protein product [Psylliodes chrysocephalus]|uniref:GH18 domain-containing protein n=1 Tax=Psylliodes chrysocephalus TaxID=3402493 RepID=A0A9P0GCG6_9CUCU|nr:unnamed protein product [Psylliodes chrysocephala]
MKLLLLFTCVVFLNCILGIQGQDKPKKHVVCYFSSWTVYRPGNGKFDVENVDPSLCTHINFAFVGLKEDGSVNVLDSWQADKDGLNGINRLLELRNVKKDLKILVSMGGWNEGSEVYSKVAANETTRKILANNVLKFIEERGFDGFDLDWEYPGLRGGNETTDKDNFTALLKELSEVLKSRGLLLTTAVAGAVEKIDVSYDVAEVSKVVDMINVMVFDYHGSFDNFVGHVSPLYPAKIDFNFPDNETYNVDTALQHWLNKGADPQKINLGIVLYGRSFTLADKTNTSLYAPIIEGGKEGPFSRQSGILGYNEICAFHNNGTYVWDDEQKVPHRIYDEDQWVGFEDERSVQHKVDYALKNNLGGIMVWSLDYDDFRGTCGEKYPLLTTINKALNLL